MRKVSLFPILALLVFACTAPPGDGMREALRNRAEECHNYLMKGDIEDYVSCLYGCETMPKGYRMQMENVFAQYLTREKETHNGLAVLTIVGDTILDSINAVVFLEITFGDDTRERIAQPMIFANNTWTLK